MHFLPRVIHWSLISWGMAWGAYFPVLRPGPGSIACSGRVRPGSELGPREDGALRKPPTTCGCFSMFICGWDALS